MTRLIQIAVVALLLSAAALCGFGCWGIRSMVLGERQIVADSRLTLSAATAAEQKVGVAADSGNALIADVKPRIEAVLGGLNATISTLNAASAGLSKTVAMVNAPCLPGPCGTLADAAKTLNTLRGTAGKLEIAAKHEDKRLDVLDGQEAGIAAGAQQDLRKLGSAIDGIAALADDRDLRESLAHANTATGALAGMATDTQQYWHATLHPKWPKRIWSAVTGIGLDAAKFFVP